MKNLKTLIVLFLSIFAVSLSFTSCNTGDTQDYSVDQVSQRSYQTVMAGTYTGKMVFKKIANNREVGVDSVETMWTVRTDSTLTIHRFPISKLDSAINVSDDDISSEATVLRQLRTAISELPDEDVRCSYWVPNTMCVFDGGYQFLVNPLCVNSDFDNMKNTNKAMFIKKSLTYGGETHNVYFVFYLGTYGGTFVSSAHTFQFRMALASIYINDSQVPHDYYPSFTSTYFRNIIVDCVRR